MYEGWCDGSLTHVREEGTLLLGQKRWYLVLSTRATAFALQSLVTLTRRYGIHSLYPREEGWQNCDYALLLSMRWAEGAAGGSQGKGGGHAE